MMSFANPQPLVMLQVRIVLCEQKLIEHITSVSKASVSKAEDTC